ncbi:MAG: hypothetical protein AAGK23_09450 [Pseudomonadota bacterium]
MPPLHILHRILACGLGLFIVVHILVHMTAIFGVETHGEVLSFVQPAYRNMFVEPLLVLAILLQVGIGAKLVMVRWKSEEKSGWGWVQIASGIYLAYFLIMHTSAALFTRHLLRLDTDFHWAAAPLMIAPMTYVFVPYYGLGIVAIFAHLASVVHFGWPTRGETFAKAIIGGGIAAATLIVATFSGLFYEITLPQENLDYIERVFGRS